MLKKFCLMAVLLSCSMCAPKIRTQVSHQYDPLDYREEVWILSPTDTNAVKSEILGRVKIGDSGMTMNCSFSTVMEKAKEEARKIGANAIKITSHKTPDFISSCHRITADLLRIDAAEVKQLYEFGEKNNLGMNKFNPQTTTKK